MSWGTLGEGYHWSHLPSGQSTVAALRLSSLQWLQISTDDSERSLFLWQLSLADVVITLSQGITLLTYTQVKFQSESENLSHLASPAGLVLLSGWSTISFCVGGQCQSPAGDIQCSTALKPPKLAPQCLWEAKETSLVLNTGPQFIVTHIYIRVFPKS